MYICFQPDEYCWIELSRHSLPILRYICKICIFHCSRKDVICHKRLKSHMGLSPLGNSTQKKHIKSLMGGQHCYYNILSSYLHLFNEWDGGKI
jgi:hypothetical protein